MVTKRRTYRILSGLIACMGLCTSTATAQDTLRRELDEFVFTEEKLARTTSGFNTHAFDSAVLGDYRYRNMSDLLSEQSSIFIKSYGMGSLATMSLRGSSASQTAVLWNGFTLQSPMNGQIDLALLPAFFTDKADLQYGSSAAIWGSGAVGGALLLSNQPGFGKGWQADAGMMYGSFRNIQNLLKLGYGGKKFFVSVRGFKGSARNDFPFVNFTKSGSPVENQRNATLHTWGVMTEAGYVPAKGQNIIVRHWYQFNHRQIPPVMSKEKSISYQDDKNNRLTAEWNRNGKKMNSVVKAAWFDEVIDFLGEDSVLNHNRAHTLITNAEISFRPGKNTDVSGGLINTYAYGESGGYDGFPAQNRFAGLLTIRQRLLSNRMTLQVTLRQEIAGDRLVPFTPSFSLEHRLRKWLTAGLNVSRSYRVPTFNDLFWTTGNPDLQAESGWNEELFVRASKQNKVWNMGATLALYNRIIDNWIVWMPKTGYWSPENVMGVWSRGGELGGELSWKKKHWLVAFNGSASLVKSTNTATEIENDESVGKQRIYTPVFISAARLSVTRKEWRLTCSHTYTGVRYISTDNLDYLDPYQVVNLRLSYTRQVRLHRIDVFTEIHNLLDAQYQVIAQRPMPGRYYQAGLLIHLAPTF